MRTKPAAMRAKRRPRPEPRWRPYVWTNADLRRLDQEEQDAENGIDPDDYFGREA